MEAVGELSLETSFNHFDPLSKHHSLHSTFRKYFVSSPPIFGRILSSSLKFFHSDSHSLLYPSSVLGLCKPTFQNTPHQVIYFTLDFIKILPFFIVLPNHFSLLLNRKPTLICTHTAPSGTKQRLQL